MPANRATRTKLQTALVCCLFAWSGCALAQGADILWRNTTTGDVAIWFTNSGTFAFSKDLGVVPTQWTVADVRDFNGDGYSDILWRNTTTGDTVIWYLNSGGTFASSTDLGVVPAAWTVAGTGYFGPTSGQQPPDVVVSDSWQNTAMGTAALAADTPYTVHVNQYGQFNTATGSYALSQNTTGSDNTAVGFQALAYNTLGMDNTALGALALDVSTGFQNTATGAYALGYNMSGNYNTAMGANALYANSTGNNNIAIGTGAGYSLTTGSNNIDIGNAGVAGESGVIRIGTVTTSPATQTAAYIAGIYGNTASGGLPVVINSNGLLGTTTSSERFKTAIAPMGSKTAKLSELRPVTFHYKADPQGTPRYGLIAEEVAKVYPELVVRDQNGRIDGVHYDELAPMLLNEVQKQAAEIRTLKQQMAELKTLKTELRTALSKLQNANRLVADR